MAGERQILIIVILGLDPIKTRRDQIDLEKLMSRLES